MITLRHIFVGCLLLVAVAANAQQDPAYSQYNFNKLVLNPAYAGSTGELSVRMLSRWQWVGFDNAPRTQTFSIHLPTPDERHGFGMNLVSDRLGHTQSFLFNLNYAYRIPVGGGHLALGLDLGMKNIRLNHTDLDLNVVDPVFGPVNQSLAHFVAGSGIYFQNDLLYAGISMPDFLPHKLSGLYFPDSRAKSPAAMYAMAGAAIPIGESIKLRPSTMLRITQGLPIGLDLGLGAMLKDRIFLGSIWRPGNSILFQLQAYILPKLQIGYAYDFSLKDISQYSSGSHEVMLGLDLNVHHSTRDVPIRF